MNINFRQGIIAFQQTPRFMRLNTDGNVNFDASMSQTILNFADGSSNYLYYETASITDAWVIPANTPCWMYWDISTENATRTFGYTLYNPFSTTAPDNPQLNQMYFDLSTFKYQTWNGIAWSDCIRVIGGYTDGNGNITTQSSGSQIDIYQNAVTDVIVFDFNNLPMKKYTQTGYEFLNKSTIVSFQNINIDSFKYENIVKAHGTASEPITKHYCVTWQNYNTLELADPTLLGSPAFALAEHNVETGEVTSLHTVGFLVNRTDWNWPYAPNTILYVGPNGTLTVTPDFEHSIQRVGYIVSPNTIYVDITEQLINYDPTATPSPTMSFTPTATLTPTATPPPTQSATVTPTPSVTASITVSPSVTPSVTASVSLSASPTPTATASVTPSVTASVSLSPIVSPTPTVTATTSVTASITPTPSVTPTISDTPAITNTSTPTVTPTSTVTATVTPSVTPTISLTASVTETATPTPTASASFTPSVTPTISLTASPTPSVTASITPSTSITPTPTETTTVTPTISNTPAITNTSTPTVTPSPTPSITVSPSITPTQTSTPTPTPSVSVTPTNVIVYSTDFVGPNGNYLLVGKGNSSASSFGVSTFENSSGTFSTISDPPNVNTTYSARFIRSQTDDYVLAASLQGGIVLYTNNGDGTFTNINSDITGLPTFNSGNFAINGGFSNNDNYMVIGQSATPYVTFFSRSGNNFTSLSSPSTLPTYEVEVVGWSPNGTYLIVGGGTSSNTTCYQNNNNGTFTALSGTGLTTQTLESISWSADSNYVAIGIAVSPYLIVYANNGNGTFTPVTLPSNSASGLSVAFSPNGDYLAYSTTNEGTTSLGMFQNSSGTFTNVSVTVTGAPSIAGWQHDTLSWSLDSKYLSLGYSNTQNVYIIENNSGSFSVVATLVP
jgi:hypothetical protein